MANLMVEKNSYRAFFMLSRFQKKNYKVVAPNGYNGEEPIKIIERIDAFEKEMKTAYLGMQEVVKKCTGK